MNSLSKCSLPLVAVLLALAGCNDTPTTPEADATATDGAMAGMSDTQAAPTTVPTTVKAKSTGTITAIDATAGTVTLDHAAIPEAKWPAMAMGFSADPALLGDLKVGDKVAFDVEIAGSSGKVTAITKE